MIKLKQEMDAAAQVEEEAPWDEVPASPVPPPPPLAAGDEDFPDGTEPITRDLEADMQAQLDEATDHLGVLVGQDGLADARAIGRRVLDQRRRTRRFA